MAEADHIKNARAKLAALAGLHHETQASERRILEAAIKQLDNVERELQGRSGLADPALHMQMLENRARLKVIIAQARANLA